MSDRKEGGGKRGRESDSVAADRDVENDMRRQTVRDVGKCDAADTA